MSEFEYEITRPNGAKEKTDNLEKWARENDIDVFGLRNILYNKHKFFKGFTVVKLAGNRKKEYIVTDPEGKELVINNLSKYCREHGLYSSALISAAQQNKPFMGYSMRYVEPPKVESVIAMNPAEVAAILIETPAGDKIRVADIKSWAMELGLSVRHMFRVVRGTQKSHKNYKLAQQ